MQELARLGLFLSCLLAIWVGFRTLLIWRRTRMLPELVIGANVLAIATGGAVLTALKAIELRTGEPSPAAPFAFGLGCMVLHVVAQNVGNWKIFRPGDHWPFLVVSFATMAALGWMAWSLVVRDPSVARSAFFAIVRLVGMTWGALECFHYAAQLGRRVALGLADPMIAHRIRLWGFGALAQCVAIGLDLAALATTGESVSATPVGLHAMSALALVGTGCVALAFFPPKAYVRMISPAAESA